MSQGIVELAQIRLATGKTEADLLAASKSFQSEFLSGQDGFLSRDLIRKDDGTYVDIIRWQSRAQADAVFAKAQASEVAGQYFSVMQFDPDNMETGVEHCALIASHSA